MVGMRFSRAASLTAGTLSSILLLGLLVGVAAPPNDSSPTTELSCNFGMGKDQKSGSCAIAVPQGCVVANFPGTSKPWSNVTKGGNTQCRFDEKATDWKTRVTGSCSRCKTPQCSARFGVMVRCGG
jgi:hypothetical protein